MAYPIVQLTAGRYVLRLAELGDLRKCADALLTAGIYTYSLGELFTYTRFSRANPDWLFEDAVRELGMTLPSRQEAAVQIAKHHLVGIVEGRWTPAEGLSDLRKEMGGWTSSEDELVTAAGCQELVNRFAYNYEQVIENIEVLYIERDEGTRQFQEVDREVMPKIVQWIRERYGVPFDAGWRTATVNEIAQAIAAEAAFDRLPILADALEDGGCTNAAILEHCRAGGEHVRGCWVVDLILGK